jgi:hypothetical protein
MRVEDQLDGGAGDATPESRRLSPQAGPEGVSAAQAEGKPEGSAEGMRTVDESEVEFKSYAHRQINGASRR